MLVLISMIILIDKAELIIIIEWNSKVINAIKFYCKLDLERKVKGKVRGTNFLILNTGRIETF